MHALKKPVERSEKIKYIKSLQPSKEMFYSLRSTCCLNGQSSVLQPVVSDLTHSLLCNRALCCTTPLPDGSTLTPVHTCAHTMYMSPYCVQVLKSSLYFTPFYVSPLLVPCWRSLGRRRAALLHKPHTQTFNTQSSSPTGHRFGICKLNGKIGQHTAECLFSIPTCWVTSTGHRRICRLLSIPHFHPNAFTIKVSSPLCP